MANNRQHETALVESRRVVRPALAGLQLALDFAQDGADPRPFVGSMIHPRDGGTWVRAGAVPHDPALQHEVVALFRALVEGRNVELDLNVRFGIERRGRHTVVSRASRPWRDVFLYRLIRMLEDVGVERLRVCAAPDRTHANGVCGRLFVKVTQKKYCSKRCQSRITMRTRRRKEREEDARLKEGHHGRKARKR